MSINWLETTIGDQVTLQRGVDITKKDFRPGSIPVISSGGVGGYHDTPTSSNPGVILGRKGVVGSVYYTPDPYWAHDTTLWVKDFKGNHPRYVYYFFLAKTAALKNLDVGSANPTLNRNHVHPMEIKWAPFQEQKAIAHILGMLDDKIELNRKTNETLEDIAKALFKSWFVDFDPVRARAEGRSTGLPDEISDLFPDSFEESELGDIPRGWNIVGLNHYLLLQRGFDLPAKQRIKGAYPVVAASGISSSHNSPMAKAPGVVTGRSGVLGNVFYVQQDFFPLNTTLWVKEFYSATPIFAYFLLGTIDFSIFNAGSAVPTLNRNHLGSLEFAAPSKKLIECFTEISVPLMKALDLNNNQISTLERIRSSLLPRLISGELRVPDAEKMIEEVSI